MTMDAEQHGVMNSLSDLRSGMKSSTLEYKSVRKIESSPTRVLALKGSSDRHSSFAHETITIARTQPMIERLKFDWKIENFGAICPPGCTGFQPCRSSVFTIGDKVGKPSNWCFELRHNSGYLSLILCREKIRIHFSANQPQQDVPCEVTILAQDGTSAITGRMSPYPAKTRDDIMVHVQEMAQKLGASAQPREFAGWKKFISIHELWDQHARFFGTNDAIHFQMVLDIAGVVQVKSAEEVARDELLALRAGTAKDHQRDISDDLEALLNNADCSNLVLHCGSHVFSVHKQILQVRCPKFYLWLLELAHENSKIRICKSTDPLLSKVVKITSIDSETLKSFLEYIYTGCVKSLPRVFSKWRLLLILADRNHLQKLKELCFFHMLTFLDANTVGPMICLTHQYGAKDHILEFIRAFYRLNYMILMQSLEFKKLRQSNQESFRFLNAIDASLVGDETKDRY